MTTLNCFRCDKVLESANPDREHNQPYAGTSFQAQGQYGSTVFDPNVWTPVTQLLVLNACDECLLQNKAQVLHATRTGEGVNYTYETWEPDITVEHWREWFHEQNEE